MKAQRNPLAGDGLERALAVALDAMLRRRVAGQGQVETLKTLRWQMDRVLTEAPITGDTLEAIAFRARLAALCGAELAKLEARVS
jgi:hypothetical protein